MRLQTAVVLGLTLAGFALRLHYLTTAHPFFDEYTTVLAARQILRHGWPMLPSGLFYEHGLLSTYLIAPFTALFIEMPIARWQPAHWGLMLSRWPSLLVGTATIPLIYTVGRDFFRPARPPVRTAVALLAAGLFALSPEGVVWGGRARMYALATLLVLLLVYWAYRGASYPAPARFRWLALAVLLAVLLTQFGALILLPPLVVAMLAAGGWSYRGKGRRSWFLQRQIIPELIALGAIVGLAILVKRLGQPLGAPSLASEKTSSLLAELAGTVAYQTALYFTWPDTLNFLGRQFGVPHHFWLTLVLVAGVIVALGSVLLAKNRPETPLLLRAGACFLSLIVGLIIVEMVTLLEPFRRNPRYLVMYLPLFYLIAAAAALDLARAGATLWSRWLPPKKITTMPAQVGLALLFLTLFTTIGLDDLRIALLTPEPAYEQAFAYIRTQHQPGDALLTMNTPAAALYAGQVDGFTVQSDADQFLLDSAAGPVDRWLGAPWIGSPDQFAATFEAAPRTWFVIDTIRLPVYFRGSWLAILNSQMEQVWAADNALVYRTRSNRRLLPAQPQTRVETTLGDSVRLVGYSADQPNPESLDLTLFWQPLAALPTDYTTFLHLRSADGAVVAQRDSQPLDGSYPTSQWQPGETIIDPMRLPLPADLPAGTYRLFAGLYRLDTLQRLPVANDSSGENAVPLGEVTLP